MAPRLVRSVCDRESYATLIRHRMGDQKFIVSSSVLWKARSAVGPSCICVGYDLFFLCLTHEEGLCPSSSNINKLMMMISRLIPHTKAKHFYLETPIY
jgi:hypothetical protein